MKYTLNAPDSRIKEIDVSADRTQLEASFALPDAITPQEVADFKTKLQQQGYTVLTGEKGNEAVLRVHGAKSANNLLVDMANANIISGDYTAQEDTVTTAEEEKEPSFKKTALLVSGAAYLAGDSSVMLAGLMRKDYAEVAQGFVWAVPSVGLLVNATQTAEGRMGYLYRDFKEFLEHNAIETPVEVQNFLHSHEAKNDLLHGVQRFCNDHGPVFNNWMQVTGAALGIKAGFNQDNHFKSVASAIMGTGMMLGAVLPEGEKVHQRTSASLGHNLTASATQDASATVSTDTTTPEPVASSGGMFDWFMEKPQRFAGIGALTQNFIKVAGTVLVDNKRQREFEGGKNADGSLAEDGLYHTQKKEWLAKKEEARHGLNFIEGVENGTYTDPPEFLKDKGVDVLKQNYEDLSRQAVRELDALETKKIKYDLSNKAARLDQASIGFYMLANSLYAMTDKENGADLVKSGGINTMVELAANIVANAPSARQATLTHEIATFLGNHSYVPLTTEDVIVQIHDKVNVITPLLDKTPANQPETIARLERIYAEEPTLDAQKAALENLYQQSGVQVNEKEYAGKITVNAPVHSVSA
jgi:hypothetical protein